MQNLEIKRTICNKTHTITLTDEELELAYRIMERRYLEEDFANAIADASQDPSMRFHTGHLDEFPELLIWLCKHYDKFFDANMAHSELIELTLNHLKNKSPSAAFFNELIEYTTANCNGYDKELSDCEKNCDRYYDCSGIAAANDRCVHLETLCSLVAMHTNGECHCFKTHTEEYHCPAAKYLWGEIDLSEFYDIACGKEAE